MNKHLKEVTIEELVSKLPPKSQLSFRKLARLHDFAYAVNTGNDALSKELARQILLEASSKKELIIPLEMLVFNNPKSKKMVLLKKRLSGILDKFRDQKHSKK